MSIDLLSKDLLGYMISKYFTFSDLLYFTSTCKNLSDLRDSTYNFVKIFLSRYINLTNINNFKSFRFLFHTLKYNKEHFRRLMGDGNIKREYTNPLFREKNQDRAPVHYQYVYGFWSKDKIDLNIFLCKPGDVYIYKTMHDTVGVISVVGYHTNAEGNSVLHDVRKLLSGKVKVDGLFYPHFPLHYYHHLDEGLIIVNINLLSWSGDTIVSSQELRDKLEPFYKNRFTPEGIAHAAERSKCIVYNMQNILDIHEFSFSEDGNVLFVRCINMSDIAIASLEHDFEGKKVYHI